MSQPFLFGSILKQILTILINQQLTSNSVFIGLNNLIEIKKGSIPPNSVLIINLHPVRSWFNLIEIKTRRRLSITSSDTSYRNKKRSIQYWIDPSISLNQYRLSSFLAEYYINTILFVKSVHCLGCISPLVFSERIPVTLCLVVHNSEISDNCVPYILSFCHTTLYFNC